MNSITFDELYKKIKLNIKNTEELASIKKAYNFALEHHLGQKRLNGEDFITHPLTVASILNDLNVDAVTLEAALLHEVLNNGLSDIKELEENFSLEVVKIVDSYTKINKLEPVDESLSGAIYLRKVLVGLATDVRVLFIKLADRLHNMRTNYAIDINKQKSKAIETENVLIPIAHRLGINSIKSELEDLCLYYTKKDVYEDILKKLNETKKELSSSLEEMRLSIINILTEQGLTFKIKGRVKSVYSIYNKLNKGRDWNEIYDILALRVILEDVKDCYMAVGLVHAKYRPIPKRFKDYIAMPKANMYQSLHTTVFGVDGHLFEIQFRTFEMDEFAEKGMASHWSYKENGTKKVQYIMEQKLEMFRNLIEREEESDDKTFNDLVNNEMFNEMIYVFTPKGDVIELPLGSTPIDFAYRIHSDIGDATIGAIVNDNIVPLNHELVNNDIVKINTSNNAKPNKDWLNFVKTSQARNKIKSYFSKQDRTDMIKLGKELLEKEIKLRKLKLNEVLNEENVKKIIKDLKLKTIDDIYLSIGTLRFTASYIISLTRNPKENITDTFTLKRNIKCENKTYKNDIVVAGIENIMINLGKCCNPVKGDEIVGFVTLGQGVTIHRSNCENVVLKKERLIDVKWNIDSSNTYLAKLIIDINGTKNYITDILAIFTKRNVSIDSFNTKIYDDGIKYVMKVLVLNKDILDKLIVDLNNLNYVRSVKR